MYKILAIGHNIFVIQDVSKKSFAMGLRVLLCDECYENVYTSRRTYYPAFEVLNDG
jgi:hypothetical protein